MSILQTILNKVSGQVSEDYFRSQLLEELGSTNFDSDAADTAGFALHPILGRAAPTTSHAITMAPTR